MAFLTRRFAPPTLINSDGDSLEICTAALTTSNAVVMAAALDRTYERVPEADPPTWLHERTTGGMDLLNASITLEDWDLTVSTTSGRRMDDVLATIRRLDPLVDLIADERHPMPTTREAERYLAARPTTGSPFVKPDAESPEIQQAMADYIAKYEQEWLDLPIPALAGVTPREAADDPTRRDDLRRLLDSFDTGEDSPVMMSAGRLRVALGLEPA